MIIVSFLLELFGATMLLLFAVRMVRTGIERAFGAGFQRQVTARKHPIGLAIVGVFLAILLQSSAAVTLLVSGFAGSGALAFTQSMAVVLGGDLGSAFLIQILSLKLSWLAPALLTVGGILFLKTEQKRLKQAGRIILGIALILISLGFLRDAIEPIRESALLPAISGYLERDFLTAFIVGAGLAFIMHSSVATILMVVAIVSVGALPFSVGVSILLGANMGSALIPVWLSRGMDPLAQRVPLANLIVRGLAGVMALMVINLTSLTVIPTGWNDGQSLILLHIGFNCMLLLFLPFLSTLERPVSVMLPIPKDISISVPTQNQTVLNDVGETNPTLALASLRHEVLRMAGLLRDMLTPVMGLYKSFDGALLSHIQSQDLVVNEALDMVRKYASNMPHDDMSKDQLKEMRELMDYAIALEAAGDIIVKRLLPLAREKSHKGIKLSKVGFAELLAINDQVEVNLKTATNVLISSDVMAARLLLEEKAEMARMERSSRKKHLRRLSDGDADSASSSDIHLETAYTLKEFNSWIISVAHPILVREGQLLTTRLVE
ncbi:Na/Pi co-transporter family protein [Thalassobium sp. R2A62]|nr:Na/Pi co-transporter family protein [Thalassobium sp. R2A62]